jgi:hypothetical protein
VIGFANPDNAAGTRSILDLHFPLVVNIFDAIAGALGVLCAVGATAAAPFAP